jgi:tetratricopeptide (TPR) repeat protein
MAYDEAAQREQYEAAQLYERKLAQLGADTRLSDYQRAIALVSDGKLAAAIAIMTRLAPSSRPGYPPAHFWMLDQIIAGNIDDDDPARGAAIDGHLEQLAKLSVDSPYLQLLRASRLLAKGQQSEAADMLRPLAGRLPQAAFQLLPLDVATADNATAQATAETVLRHLAAWPQSEAPFSAPMYRTWALALECLGRQSELDAVYRDWHETYPGDRRARARFARMVARDVEARLASPSTSPAALADIMQQACSLDLPPEWLTEQVRRLYATRDNAIIKSEIPEQTLVRLVDDPKTPIVLLEAIGSAAAQRAEWSRAEACFASITRRDARHAVGWNNWAWVLLQQADADLDQALEMANRAVALSPGAFRFRETRGQIYVRRQDWQPAVSDLQLAVNGMPNDKSIHASLATALAALGRHEEAAMHRQQTD